MKNKELLNICYKFFNRFITASELIKMIKNIDKDNLNKNEINKIDKMIFDIEIILKDNPNVVDDYVLNKKEKMGHIIKKLDVLPKDSESKDFLIEQLDSMKKDYEKEMDSHERWFKVTDYLDKNDYFNKCFDNLSDYELLEFIAQYIKAPFPPQISEEQFDRLVKVGIENDEREWLWRLAFNYEYSGFNFESIIDYFISVKDGYYLCELISAIGEQLNIDDIINKIDDKELIEDIKARKSVISYFVTEEQFDRLFSKLN